jgi:hypothetical protein
VVGVLLALCVLTLTGCGFIPASEREWRLDPDDDNTEWPEDCDNDDPSVGGGPPWFLDNDRDGYGAGQPVLSCDLPEDGYVRQGGDCDDADPTSFPGATELCDGRDQNCDDVADDGFAPVVVYSDDDGDGYGGVELGETCGPYGGTVSNPGDCDDTDAQAKPGAPERCNAKDDDCDGNVDEAILAIWWADADEDTWGDPGTATETCDPEPGWITRGEDCDDTNWDSYPYAPEICDDGRDNDCDGEIDEERTRWTDGDGDGFGDPDTARTACDGNFDEVDNDVDCDDTNAWVNPALPETCADGLDNDCSGVADDGDTCEAGE